jgi:5-formyltetrahydrofolate cyclo-ligase
MTVEDRKKLRREMLDKRTHCPSEELLPPLAANLQAYLSKHIPECLGAYWPIKNEPDLRPFLSSWLKTHPQTRIALPLIRGGQMTYGLWRPEDALTPGYCGIPEPDGEHAVAPDTLIVPCVAFDSQKYRLGYGGGWFDRYLADDKTARPHTVGIAFEFSHIPTICAEPHDIPLDVIISDKGIYL